VVVRGCPLGTVQDRCEWQACGTASEDDPCTAWRRWLRLDQRVRPVLGDYRLVGKRPRAHGSRTPEPKLRTRCAGWCSPGVYQALELGGRRSAVPPCTRSSRGVVARPVSNLVSIGVPVWSRTPPALRSSATGDRIGRPGTARSIPVCCGRPRSIAYTNPSSGRGEAAATS
jgi:hypothetical protein